MIFSNRVIMRILMTIISAIIISGFISCKSAGSEFNVYEYDKKFRARFIEAFPVLAGEIVDFTKKSKGTCVDIGCGPGYLALAVAKITELKVYALDISEQAVDLAKQYAEKEGLSKRVFPVHGDVHKMPFDDDSMDLIVSRGSLPFWSDKTLAFKEIRRILKPDGKACIGCGFGSGYVKIADMSHSKNRKPPKKFRHDDILQSLVDAGITEYTVIDDYNKGYWIIISK